jgi:RNA polymerase sigma factor (TIGR02999 family)
MADSSDRENTDALTAALYERLRRAAQSCLRRGASPTLQPTALLHEAYCKLAATERAGWRNEEHFLATAATAMRQIITDHARRRRAHKRSGGERVALTDLAVGAPAGIDLIGLDDALARLAAVAPDLARLVELRCYAGLSMAQIAEVQQTSLSTVEKAWKRARAWLSHALELAGEP